MWPEGRHEAKVLFWVLAVEVGMILGMRVVSHLSAWPRAVIFYLLICSSLIFFSIAVCN